MSLALVPKFTGFLSLVGSLLLILDVVADNKKRNKFYYRFMTGFASVDCVVSIFFIASTWMIPASSGYHRQQQQQGVDDTGAVWGAIGTEETCVVQGFFLQFNSSSCIYNAVLTLYYVLVIRHSVKEETLMKYEFAFHAVPLTFGVVTASVCAAMGWFGPASLWCWIHDDFEHAYIFRWVFSYAIYWSSFGLIVIGMLLIMRTVRATEKKSAKFDFCAAKIAPAPPHSEAASRGPTTASVGAVPIDEENQMGPSGQPQSQTGSDERAPGSILTIQSFSSRWSRTKRRSRKSSINRSEQVVHQALFYGKSKYFTVGLFNGL